ncbi:hypothetical protein L211DRAFT_899326 [Terfezia boudieri ATCC MYA-4762]|uniref:Uncharacterized protein n=1 Tax=Terfezia boudieri ATCC MYA-4762 TaxID=1051890 RepID=A0A3N4LM57_9PEZI|nr:hypothetical protein L211DRAFT_899326 [Terfezia boudieri ATCC MYA-4762]
MCSSILSTFYYSRRSPRLCRSALHHVLRSASSSYTTYALPELPALATGTTTYSCFSNSTANSRAFRTAYMLPILPALATGTTTTYSRFSNSTANPRAFRTTYTLLELPALATIPMYSQGCQLWLQYLCSSGTASSSYTTYTLLPDYTTYVLSSSSITTKLSQLLLEVPIAIPRSSNSTANTHAPALAILPICFQLWYYDLGSTALPTYI